MVTEQADVEMKNVDSPAVAEQDAVKADPDTLTIEDIKEQARHIEKAVTSKEPRFILRILRALMPTRKRLNDRVLRKIVTGFFTHSSQDREALLGCLEEVRLHYACSVDRFQFAGTIHSQAHITTG
uniref:26S proteasome non-ATPase regulatory subunit 3 N-terminal TPR repeats domain-containing protein n=1 Tax=Rhipicephalus microplus TaxID=6941 RepID=A0A6M2CTP8_RHIMP